MTPKRTRTPPAATAAPDLSDTEERYLLGPQHLQDVLDQVASLGTRGPWSDRAALSDRWRVAAQEYARLANAEAGAADRPAVRPLPKAMARHLAQLVELPGVRRTFDTVPVAFGLVALDSLVISQYSMTQAVVDRIVAAHPLPLGPRRLAELCLPLKAPPARFHLAAQEDRSFTFVARRPRHALPRRPGAPAG